MTASELNTLTTFEQDDLETCEQIVDYGIGSFVAACQALRTIREKRLYRDQYPSWSDYIAGRWNALFTDDSTANRWITAANVIDTLTPIGVTNIRESHARAIAGYHADIQMAVAMVGLRAAELEQRPLTASHFRHAGVVIAEMVATNAVELGDGEQHPMTDMLAASVVERRRESVQQHRDRKARQPVYAGTLPATDERGRGCFYLPVSTCKLGRRYEVRVYEVDER